MPGITYLFDIFGGTNCFFLAAVFVGLGAGPLWT
jgi:hypothetical protein